MGNMTFWMICLAVFMILYGVLGISNVTFAGSMIVLYVLAIATGILLFVQK